MSGRGSDRSMIIDSVIRQLLGYGKVLGVKLLVVFYVRVSYCNLDFSNF